MNLARCLALVVACVIAQDVAAAELGIPPDPPFRVYSVADGLNQKGAQYVAQDSRGFLWVGSFGGLNRFDGANFTSFTTRHGLRNNFVTALLSDSQDRLWVGDAEGGITLIEQGKVVLTLDPPKGHQGIIRSLVELNGVLYMGTEPGGLRRLSMASPGDGIELLFDLPSGITTVAVGGSSELLLVSENRLYSYQLQADSQPQLLEEGITSLSGSAVAGVYVGSSEHQVGRWDDGKITWLPERYAEPVERIVFNKRSPTWIHTKNFLIPFGAPGKQITVLEATDALEDAEGVVWIARPSGLARYLGSTFTHYSLPVGEISPAVFAIQPDAENGYWFGTDLGLMRLDAGGNLTSVAAQFNMPKEQVRSLRLASDKQTLWVPHINGRIYKVNTQTLASEVVFPVDNTVVVSLELDENDRVWAGTFDGSLLMHDPRTGRSRELNLGDSASIYSMSMGPDGWLWFTANYSGVYRLNTRLADAQPEQVISIDDIKRNLFTQILVSELASGRLKVLFTTTNGGVFEWLDGNLKSVIDDPFLADKTMYSIASLADNTLVIASNKGAYRYNSDTQQLQHYGPLNGFLGIEGKAHAMYLEGENTLWIGTAGGVSAMDISQPMSPVRAPASFITRLSLDKGEVSLTQQSPTEVIGGSVMVEYAAVSTRAPNGLEYSHILNGSDGDWSPATTNKSVGYSHLPPGRYEFQVRARHPGSVWGDSDRWSFVVPTPFWKTHWFIGLLLLGSLVIIRVLVQLRLRSIARANQRLREEVAERTRSIELGRAELEKSNRLLSTEIDERQRSDVLRADVEARFHQAYQNSPIGMALVNKEGLVYDANPSLKALFWPEAAADDKAPLLAVIAEHDQSRFETFLAAFSADELDTPSMQFECVAFNGNTRRIDFLPSAVRDDVGDLRYILLLANDVTDSYAMTRQLKYQASFDELTGLLNRRAYSERLKETGLNSKNDAFLLLLDLDQFKVVNDTCGHAAGDELLRTTAKTILADVRDTDTVARIGGDEFAVILTRCSQKIALQRAEDIRRSIQDLEFFWEAEVFRIGASIGVVAIGEAATGMSELQQLADAACYAAKDAGRNRVHLVSSTQDAAHEHRGDMRWVQRVKSAIDTNGFVLFGQRIMSLTDEPAQSLSQERIEVLIRLRDRPSDRLIPPGAFLPVVERYGLHDKLDLWVVSQVIATILSQKSKERAKRQFWVNLSGASVSDKKFSTALIGLVAEAGIPAGSLNFEITETAVIRKMDAAARLVSSLRSMGCQFALDDFGSGLSSFGYLKKLNVDCLKVDGEFIRNIAADPTDPIFVKSIIDIAHTLDMVVVTEFVEDDDILQRVRALGADYAQGFGVHRPEPLEGLVDTVIPSARAKG